MSIIDLPPMPEAADPVIVPGLLTGLGVVLRPVPAWVTDPGAITSIACGLYEIDDDLVRRDEPTLQQIEKRIAAAACFCLVVQQAYVAHLERRLAGAGA
jgi:hypothetical protein